MRVIYRCEARAIMQLLSGGVAKDQIIRDHKLTQHSLGNVIKRHDKGGFDTFTEKPKHKVTNNAEVTAALLLRSKWV